MNEPLRAIELYRGGICVRAELPGRIFGALTTANAAEFVACCPEDVLQYLQQAADGLPPNEDDSAWAQLITIKSFCLASWVTEEKLDALKQADEVRIREGVRIFRAAR